MSSYGDRSRQGPCMSGGTTRLRWCMAALWVHAWEKKESQNYDKNLMSPFGGVCTLQLGCPLIKTHKKTICVSTAELFYWFIQLWSFKLCFSSSLRLLWCIFKVHTFSLTLDRLDWKNNINWLHWIRPWLWKNKVYTTEVRKLKEDQHFLRSPFI